MPGRPASPPLRWTRRLLDNSLGWHARTAPQLAEVRELALDLGDRALPARLYVPEDSADRPTIVYFHGGGFVFSGLATHEALVRWLAEAAGMRVLAVSYRLAPESPFPGQVDDALAAVEWARANRAALGSADPRLVIAGDSAGGYLAARVVAQAGTAGGIAALLLLSPLVHVDDALWRTTTFRDFRWVGRGAVAYIRRALGPNALPPLAPPGEGPPTIIVAGGWLDPVRADAESYASALRGTNTRVVTRHFPQLAHGGLNLTRLSPLARRALRETGSLLRETVGPR